MYRVDVHIYPQILLALFGGSFLPPSAIYDQTMPLPELSSSLSLTYYYYYSIDPAYSLPGLTEYTTYHSCARMLTQSHTLTHSLHGEPKRNCDNLELLTSKLRIDRFFLLDHLPNISISDQFGDFSLERLKRI